MGQFSNSFAKHFSYLCEYAIRFDLSCSYCEYPAIFHCLHCSPSCFDPDSLLLAYLWLGLSWIDCISANKSFSSSKTSSRKPYTSSKQQERQKHSVEITINVPPRAVVVAGGVPLWRASWPRVVSRSSSGPVALGAPVGFSVAVVPSPTPGAVAPGFTGWLRGARGGRPRTRLIVPAAGPCRIKGAGRAPRRTRSGPRDGVVPGGSLRLRSWAACAAVVWRVWTRSLMRPVSRTVRLATGDSAGAPGLFRVDAGTAHFGSEDATPGSRACVRVRAMLGRVGRAGLPGAFWCASPSLWPFLVRSLLVRPPPGWGCPVCGCCWFFFFASVPVLPLVAPPLCPALRIFRPRVPWPLASCPPPLFFASPPTVCPVVSCFACFPAWGAVGLGVLLPPPLFPPPLPVVSGVSCFPVALGPCAPPPPPFFFPWFLAFSFSVFFCFLLFFFFPFFFAGCPVRGWFVCLGPSGVPRWCCPCRCSMCAGWCCVVLAVGPGCPLLSLGGSWCHASVVLSFSGRVARRPVVRRGVSWCSAALCCVLLRRAVVWWCAVVLCRLFASLPVPVVCFLPLRVCCVCSGVSCCVFPVLPVRCAVRVVCAVSGGWCCCFLVSLPFVGGVLVALVARRCSLVVCVGSGARVWSGRRWASSLWCPVPLCCVLWRCAAVWCCAVVPCLLFLFFSLLVALVSCCSPLVLGSGPVPGRFCFCAPPVRCCAEVPASLLSAQCSLGRCLVLLPVVFVCLLLGLAVLCCLPVGPGGYWCRVSVACCGVSLGAVLRRVAARFAAWRCVVVRCVVSCCSVWCCCAMGCVLGRCPSSWGPVPSGAVFCLVPPCCVCFAVVCRRVVLSAVVLCAVCALGCRVVRFLSSLPCVVLLCGPLSLGALLPCAVPRGAVLPRGAVVSCPAALLGLFLAWLWLYLLEKPLQNFVKYFFPLFLAFENKIKLYTTQHTRVQQDHVRWGPQEQQAFDEVKNKVANAKCLGVPRAQGEMILVTDASNVGGV